MSFFSYFSTCLFCNRNWFTWLSNPCIISYFLECDSGILFVAWPFILEQKLVSMAINSNFHECDAGILFVSQLFKLSIEIFVFL